MTGKAKPPEYSNFEALAKRLIAVPKKEIAEKDKPPPPKRKPKPE